MRLLGLVATAALLFGAPAFASVQSPPAASPPVSAVPPAAAPAKRPSVVVRPKSRGYGFLPGYEPPDRPPPRGRPSLAGDDGGPPRFYGWWGRRYYGFGGAGFAGSRWNGGSIGPCWTYTPVGYVWNCGR